MNFGRLVRTIKELKLKQVIFQVKYRFKKTLFIALESPSFIIPKLKTPPIAKIKCEAGDKFSFLNLEHEFAGWSFTEYGMLWTYNQNYFDWINQELFSKDEGCKWIDKFINEQPNNIVGFDPYPIALRSINWVKFFCRFPDAATKPRLNSLYSQLRLLEKKLEYHLLGNHLLEDAYALYIGGSFFNDKQLHHKAKKLLLSQLDEQVLKDGAHYEQSPMYHCILLDRLLDCINIEREDGRKLKEAFATRMLGHLESIIWTDGTIPILNDSAYGIAPTPNQLFDYAKRLGLEWKPLPMKECGYRKMSCGSLEAIVDVGNITAPYQPGHTHADTFNYELRLDGKPFVIDTGISTYNKTERRQLERSTVAHNCVSPNGISSSEVWGGFRVGKRCHTVINVDINNLIDATHNGFEKPCRRKFEMNSNGFSVEDWFDGEAISYIHIAEGIDGFMIQNTRFKVEGAIAVDIKPWRYSTEYNKFHEGQEIEIKFKGHCKYTIH